MALILSIETATKVCSVALHQDGLLVALNELHQDNIHSQKIMGLIENLFAQAGLKNADLNAVAVSAGPGSYTGLRIGVAVAKGIAFAHDIPFIAVDTLSALGQMAVSYCKKNEVVIPLMDARRMEVYAKVLNCQSETLLDSRPFILDHNPFLEYLEKGKVIFIGDGAEKSKEILNHPNACFMPGKNSSSSVGDIAYHKYKNSDFDNLAYFEPNYLKDFRVIQSKKNPLLI